MTAILDRPVRTHRTAVSYRDLTPREQDIFDRAICAAEAATNAWHIKDIHEFVAAALDIQLPDNDELVQCSCAECPDDCDAIVPFSLCGEYLDGNVQRPQCTPCVKDHRRYGD